MAPGDDTDSGMESQEGSTTGSAKEASTAAEGAATDPSTASVATGADAGALSAVNPEEFTPDRKPGRDDPYGDEPDETLAERLWGLTEMFPESVRNYTYTVATTTKSSVKSVYGFSRSAFWVVFSSSIILFAPVIFEVERVQMEEAQRTQQKQMLLGPNTAVAGGGLMPPMHR